MDLTSAYLPSMNFLVIVHLCLDFVISGNCTSSLLGLVFSINQNVVCDDGIILLVY